MAKSGTLRINFEMTLQNGGTLIKTKCVDNNLMFADGEIRVPRIIRPQTAPQVIASSFQEKFLSNNISLQIRRAGVIGGHVDTTKVNRLECNYTIG